MRDLCTCSSRGRKYQRDERLLLDLQESLRLAV
nr:MAG TPA: hypothetical protein [Caudoviricetes sp.]